MKNEVCIRAMYFRENRNMRTNQSPLLFKKVTGGHSPNHKIDHINKRCSQKQLDKKKEEAWIEGRQELNTLRHKNKCVRANNLFNY